jgi:hypothetical protein
MPPEGADPRSDPLAPDAAGAEDLPDIPDARASSTAFGPEFGMETATRSSWVPERSATADRGGGTIGSGPVADAPVPARGVRVPVWQVVAVVAGALVPFALWLVNGVGSPVDRVADPVTRRSPSVLAPTLPRPTTDGATVIPPGVSVSGPLPVTPTLPTRSQPSRVPMPSPPVLVPVPSVPVTPVPPGARTIRFEAQAQAGAVVEVSLSDASHLQHDYPPQHAPVAFEVAVTSTVSTGDYYSLRVRTPSGRPSPAPDVSCRILVDGVVVTSQQGQGYVTCYISPYYDIRRT